MATAWDRIDKEYRAYLEKIGCCAEEYNSPSFNRGKEFNAFMSFQERQEKHAQTNDVVEFVRKQMREAETLVFSEVKSYAFRSLTHELGMRLEGAEWRERPTDLLDMDGFTWLGSKEDSPENRDAYMNHLRENIQWPDGYAIVDCNEHKDLLSVSEIVDGKHKTSGNIDVVLTARKEIENRTIRQNIRAGIELKKSTNKGDHEQQLILQHVTASLLNPGESVVTVMTDLNERWHFYWFGRQRGVLYKCIVGRRSEAKFLFEHIFDDPDSIDATLFPMDFLTRATWRVFLGSDLDSSKESPSGESRGDDDLPGYSCHSRQGGSGYPHSFGDRHEDKKDDDKGGMKQGPQPPANNNCDTDVANELDLLDFVDEDEKRSIVLSFFAKHVLPRMTHVPDQNRQSAEGEPYQKLSNANLSVHNAS